MGIEVQRSLSSVSQLPSHSIEEGVWDRRRLDSRKQRFAAATVGEHRRKRQKPNSEHQQSDDSKDTSADFAVKSCSRPEEKENDPLRLEQRQKQVDYGKNTLGYERYCLAVPKDKRKRGVHFWTPNIYRKCSKRAFAGQVRVWRRELHKWDPPKEDSDEDAQGSLQSLSKILEDCDELVAGDPSLSGPLRPTHDPKENKDNNSRQSSSHPYEEFEDLDQLLDFYEEIDDDND